MHFRKQGEPCVYNQRFGVRIKLPKSRDFSKQRFVMSHCFEICVSQWAILKTVKARSDTAAATGHAHIDIAQFLY